MPREGGGIQYAAASPYLTGASEYWITRPSAQVAHKAGDDSECVAALSPAVTPRRPTDPART
ncbi:hypothetical protein ACVWY3_006909 [Bradyrhizobium sp. USDA 4486]